MPDAKEYRKNEIGLTGAKVDPGAPGRGVRPLHHHHGVEKLPARLLAAPAGLLADLAVGVLHGHALAFVAAASAARDAGFEHRPRDVRVGFGLAADDLGRGRTDRGAVHAEPDAFDEVGDIRLTEVVVGIGGARLRAVGQRVDRSGDHSGVHVEGARVAVEQLACVAHDSPWDFPVYGR